MTGVSAITALSVHTYAITGAHFIRHVIRSNSYLLHITPRSLLHRRGYLSIDAAAAAGVVDQVVFQRLYVIGGISVI